MQPSAMILAAGLGTRLRPLTLTTPKPLVKVDGITLLDRTLIHVREGGLTSCVINTHYLPDAMRRAIANIHDLTIHTSYEPVLLDSGGGVKNALVYLPCDILFLLNADTFFAYQQQPLLAQLLMQWDPGRMDALLYLVPQHGAIGHEGGGDFEVHADGTLTRARGDETLIFTGIQLIKKSFYETDPRSIFSVNDLWNQMINMGRLHGCIGDGSWYHISTPASLLAAEEHLRMQA